MPELICGVDEVGRGPLAGPVVAAAVILPDDHDLPGLTDSKKLSERRREVLFESITAQAIACSVGRAEVDEIDDINILHASMLAMRRAVLALTRAPGLVLVDGNRVPEGLPCVGRAIVGGDLTEPAISAASIVAKVTRDREMVELDGHYPGYGLAGHKGYPTKAHLLALAQLGATPIHRRSFAPVRRVLS